MTVSRRNALKYTLSATALAGLRAVAAAVAPPRASADRPRLTEVNVKDYGATGDGTTDDTEAIHAARDAAGVGGKITIPPGTYMVSELTAGVGDQMWELSDEAIIKMRPGTVKVFSITAVGTSVLGGVFDCSNGTDPEGQSGVFITSDGVTIRDATIRNSPSYAIRASNCNRLTISDCTIINSGFEGIFIENGSTTSSDIYDFSITGNLVDNSMAGQRAGGIYVRGNSTTTRVSRATVRGNTVRLPSEPSYETGGIIVFNGSDYAVTNNFVAGGFLGITCDNPIRATLSENVVRGFSYVGIELPGNVDTVTVAGNTIDADGIPATAGIQASRGPVNEVRIVGNNITNFSESSLLISFNSVSVSQWVSIERNVLTAAVGSGEFIGVYFNGSITGLTMSENIVDGFARAKSSGIQFLKNVFGVSITRNRFANLSDAAVLMGSYDARDTLDFIVVVDNDVVNCGATLKDATANGAVVGSNIFT